MDFSAPKHEPVYLSSTRASGSEARGGFFESLAEEVRVDVERHERPRVTGDPGDEEDVGALLDQAGDGVVAKVVQAQSLADFAPRRAW